jgi:hypothetical protein
MHLMGGFRAFAGVLRGIGLAAAAVIWPAEAALAQSPGTAGLYLEAEGQLVFGASHFDAGIEPPTIFDLTGPGAKRDEGNGLGGALALGYAWSNGWGAAVRYRRLEADDTTAPVDTGIFTFAAGSPLLPGGFLIGALGARTEVESDTSLIDFEVGKDLNVGGGRLHVFGGVTYASIERDVSVISEDCGCIPFSVHFANDFHGAGPKIGARGSVPVTGAVSFVGGISVAALFGKSKFASRLDDPLFPMPSSFSDSDRRTVAALDGHAGIAIGLGPGSLTLGYRVDAIFGALDTDQRVSPLFRSVGYPKIGDDHANFVEHGPFARFTLPLSAVGD